MTPLLLIPSSTIINFIYSATLSSGDPIPSDLVTFDSAALEFTVKSSDQ